jgi:hypothetical protein
MQPKKTSPLARAALLVLGALACLAPPAPAASRQSRYDEFVSKFKQALTINASDEMARLVKSYPDESVNFVDNLCAEMAKQNSDELEKQFAALNRAWKAAFATAFVDKVYVYHSELALDPKRRADRGKLLEAYNATVAKLAKNNDGPRDGPTYELVGADFTAQAKAFEELGDAYYAARAEASAGECYDESRRGKSADLRKACEHYGRAVAFFEKIELRYKYFQELKARHERLVLDGWATPLPDPNAPDPNAPVAAPASSTVLEATFEPVPSPDLFARPSYHADDVYQIWSSVYLQAKDSTATLQPLEQGPLKGGPLFVRSSASQIGIDFDRDGKVDRSVGITGNMALVEVEIGKGGDKRKWAFLMKTGIQEDTYQTLKVNLQPDDKQASLYTLNAASIVATIGETTLRILDDNMDGVYGSDPMPWGYVGLPDGVHQPELDSIVIGESKRALPWSQYVDVAGAWYELKPKPNGAQIEAVPATVKLGRLRAVFKGGEPAWLVVRGTGALEKCYFDLMADAKKGISVPVGTYEFFAGELRVGKKQQVAKSLILPGATTPKWTVAEGAETLVTLGAPFKFDFQCEVGEDKVKVLGKSVGVVGSAGERYERTWNCTPRPEASVRKAGSKKGGKPERLAIVLDLQEEGDDGVQKYSFADTWRPLDTEIEFKKASEGVEVQLSEKKNKLFGTIESDWK